MQLVNRPLFILALLVAFGASHRVIAKVHVGQNIASGGFAANYDGSTPVDGSGTIDFAVEAERCSYELVSGQSKWPSRDPIEEQGGVNVYGFCYNNPLGFVDYLGWNPTPVNTGSYVPATAPSETSHFQDVSDASSDPSHSYQSNTGQQMIDQLKNESKNNCCVKTWTIAGHGWRSDADASGNVRPPGSGIPGNQSGPNGAGLYLNDSYRGMDQKNGGASLDGLQREIGAGNIKFCKPCTVQIHSCYISDAFILQMASVTGCKVIAAGGKCSGGGDKRRWRSGPTDHPKDDQATPQNGFRQGVPGQHVQPVGPSYPPARP
jgi:hypothetical protein